MTDAIEDTKKKNEVPPKDDPDPAPAIKEQTHAEKVADSLKPIAPATDEIWSPDPAKDQARKALILAYQAAIKADGALRTKYDAAMKSFKSAAEDLVSKSGSSPSKLEKWISDFLADGKDVHKVFTDTKELGARANSRSGKREKNRDIKRAATARYAERYKAWADPVASIGAQIGSSADEIAKLNTDINQGRDLNYAIYRLWFDYAPRLLQLSSATIDATIAPGIDLITPCLANFPERAKALKSGKDRDDGSIFLADDLDEKRKSVLKKWKDAALEQAEAETDFALRPDDTATLKSRYEAALKGEADAVKAKLTQPANN